MDIKKDSTKHQNHTGVDLSKLLIWMGWAGLWEPTESSRLVRAIYNYFAWLNIMWVASVTGLQCVPFFLDNMTPLRVANNLAVTMSFARALLTSARFVWIREKAQKLVKRMQKHTLSYENDQNTHEEIHKKARREAKLVERMSVGLYTILTSSVLSVPLILTIKQSNDGEVDTNSTTEMDMNSTTDMDMISTTERRFYLPVGCWYPWSTSNILYYIISYIHQAYAYMIIAYHLAFNIAFNLSISIHVSAQLKMLYAEFKDVRTDRISTLNTGKKYQIADVAMREKNSRFRGQRRAKNTLEKAIKDNNKWSDSNPQNALQNGDNEKDWSRLMLGDSGHQSCSECHDNVSGGGMNTDSVEIAINKRLMGCIRQHQEIISFVDDMNEVMTGGMFVQFACITVGLCLACFVLSLPRLEANLWIKFVPWVGTLVGQLFLFCWYGQRLITESERLQEAVYCCGWEDGNTNVMKSTGFILLRSQKSLCLTVGKFAIVSLDTWSQVINFTYSLFNLLRQTQAE